MSISTIINKVTKLVLRLDKSEVSGSKLKI